MRILPLGVLAVVACSNSTGVDAGDAGNDTGADTKVADAIGDPKPDPVALCQAEAKRAAALCSGSAERNCFFEKYAGLCLLERNEVITLALKCFNLPECHTFTDPGNPAIEACIRMVSTNASSTTAAAARTAYCNKCTTSGPCMNQVPFPIPFEHLSDSRNDQTAMCADAAADCMGADACLAIEFPDLIACSKTGDN